MLTKPQNSEQQQEQHKLQRNACQEKKKRRKVPHISLKLGYVSKLMQPLPRSQYHPFHQYLKWLYVIQKPMYQFILTWRQLDWKEHVTSHNWLFWQRKKNLNRMCFRSCQYPRRHKKLPNGKLYWHCTSYRL
uniref:Uncharacterized protein n=1 Tax=Magallana gigas TaxID=29159 RepID=A0A8W8JKY0_MAGGI